MTKFRPYFCKQTPVLTYVFFISPDLKHFFMKLFSLKVKTKLKFRSFLPLCGPHSLGLSAVDHLALRAWEGLLLGALVRVGLAKSPIGFLPWPVTQKYLSKPPLVSPPPKVAEGLIVGGIIIETFKFQSQWASYEVFILRAGFKQAPQNWNPHNHQSGSNIIAPGPGRLSYAFGSRCLGFVPWPAK